MAEFATVFMVRAFDAGAEVDRFITGDLEEAESYYRADAPMLVTEGQVDFHEIVLYPDGTWVYGERRFQYIGTPKGTFYNVGEREDTP